MRSRRLSRGAAWSKISLRAAETQAMAAEMQAMAAERDAKQQRIDGLIALLALARAQIVARDEHIAALYDSPSWKATIPARFILRNIKRLLRK